MDRTGWRRQLAALDPERLEVGERTALEVFQDECIRHGTQRVDRQLHQEVRGDQEVEALRELGDDSPRPFRFGLIGAGVATEIHVAAMRTVRGVEVHAIADAVPARARALATRYGIPEVHESGEALAARAPVDAIAVLTPHHLHLPYVLAAADTGRHVLVEKAIAHTVVAADELIDACRTRGVTLAGIFQNRFTSAARRLWETLADGVLGRAFLGSVTVKSTGSQAISSTPLGAAGRRRPAVACSRSRPST